MLEQPDADIYARLHPEQQPEVFDPWLDNDPRVDWLLAHLLACKPEKVLVICASSVTAQQLAEQYVAAFEKLAREGTVALLPADSGDVASMVAKAYTAFGSLRDKVTPAEAGA